MLWEYKQATESVWAARVAFWRRWSLKWVFKHEWALVKNKKGGKGIQVKVNSLSKDMKTWKSLLYVWDYTEFSVKQEGQKMSVQQTGHIGRTEFMVSSMSGWENGIVS